MKLIKISLSILLFSAVILSCKKNNEVIAGISNNNTAIINQTTIQGTWIGQYKMTARCEPAYLSFDIQPAGILHLLNESHTIIGQGTWVLNDSVFNALYIVTATQQSNSVSGVLHTESGKLDGKWQFNNNYEDTGSWYTSKM